MRMVLELSWYWSLVGAHAESWTWLGYALEVPGEAAPGARELARVVMLMNRGMEDNTAFEEDMTHKAAALQAELEHLPDPDYALPQAVVLRTMLAYFAGSPEQAEQKRLAAVGHPDPWVRAVMLMLGAAMAENFGDVEETRANVDIAAQEFTALGDRWGLATVVAMKAQLQTYDGDLEGAIASYAEAEDYLRALGAHSDEAFMAMRMANLRLRLDDLDGARREIDRFSELEDPGGFGQILGNAGRGFIAVREGDMATVEQIRDAMVAQSQSSHALGGAHGLALLSTMVTLLDIELGDLDAALKVASSGYAAALQTKDMPILAGLGVAVARLAVALDHCVDAAELLGTAARVRGIEDPTDPTIAELLAALPVRLGEKAFAAAYERGWSLSKQDAAKRLDPASLDVAGAEPLAADDVAAQARRR
jgi:hypothetical protein